MKPLYLQQRNPVNVVDDMEQEQLESIESPQVVEIKKPTLDEKMEEVSRQR